MWQYLWKSMNESRSVNHLTIVDTLGPDLQDEVLQYLPNTDLTNLALVSKNFQKAVSRISEPKLKLRLRNLIRFRSESRNLVKSEEDILEEVVALYDIHKTYKKVYDQTQYELVYNLRYMGYNEHIINSIGADILGRAPICIRPPDDEALDPAHFQHGISYYLDNTALPVIVFKYRLQFSGGDEADAIHTLRRKYANDNNCFVLTGDDAHTAELLAIEGRGCGQTTRSPVLEKTTPLHAILTQYRQAILENRPMTPVTVQPQKFWWQSEQEPLPNPVSVILMQNKP
ncbi:MAG: hypothetical protein RLZ35_1270 [Pseudomonadota bacterium]|jgi:hypothetical protein